MEPKKQRRFCLARIWAAVTSVVLCVVLEITIVAIGIAYAAADDEVTSMSIQAGATVGVIIVSCVFTAAFYFSINWLNQIHDIEHLNKKRMLKPLGANVEVKDAHIRYRHYVRASTDQAAHDNVGGSHQDNNEINVPFIEIISSSDEAIDSNSENSISLIDHTGGDMMKPFFTGKLRQMLPPQIIMLLLSSILFLLGFMALAWGITLAYNFGFGDENVIWPFIVVEAIVGIVCPLLMYIGTLLFAVVIDYVTMGRVDARKAIHSLLPSVHLLKANDNEYWVIKDTFYYLIRERPANRPVDDKTPSCDKLSRATVYFIIIIGLSFGLSTSYFMNRTIVEQTNTRECKSDLHYDCFVLEEERWVYVDCSDNDTLSRHTFIHCYTFLRFAIDNNPISSLAESFAFYLATVAFFGQAFGVVKILLRLRPTRLWGVWFIVIGVIVVGVSLFLIFNQGSISLHRDVIGCFQILMFGIFLLIVGALLLEAGQWERKKLKSVDGPVDSQLCEVDKSQQHETTL